MIFSAYRAPLLHSSWRAKKNSRLIHRARNFSTQCSSRIRRTIWSAVSQGGVKRLLVLFQGTVLVFPYRWYRKFSPLRRRDPKNWNISVQRIFDNGPAVAKSQISWYLTVSEHSDWANVSNSLKITGEVFFVFPKGTGSIVKSFCQHQLALEEWQSISAIIKSRHGAITMLEASTALLPR